MDSLVSIITPTYNHERFIGDCAESVLAQTYENWELLVVDDGSSDKTLEIIQSCSRSDSRIKAFHQENKGVWRLSETYNYALQEAQGQYIAILEGDDYWPPDKLEKQIALHEKDVLLSYGDTLCVGSDGTPIGLLPRPSFSGSITSFDFLRLMLIRKSAIQPVSAICDANALRALGGFSQGDYPAVDYPTFLRLAQLSGRFVFLPTILGYWRQHGSQITARMGVAMIEGRLNISLDQFRSLDTHMRDRLCLSERAIVEAHAGGLSESYFVAVRSALREKNRTLLGPYLRKLWKYGRTKRKIQAIYALVAMNVGLDMEPIMAVYDAGQRLRLKIRRTSPIRPRTARG